MTNCNYEKATKKEGRMKECSTRKLLLNDGQDTQLSVTRVLLEYHLCFSNRPTIVLGWTTTKDDMFMAFLQHIFKTIQPNSTLYIMYGTLISTQER